MNSNLFLALLSCAVVTTFAGFVHRIGAEEAFPRATVAWTPDKAKAANAAILAYLGEPVPPPAELDPKYNSEGLIAACRAACAKLGFEVEKLVVDDTEFPFLIFGVIDGSHDFQALPTALRSLPGYGYGGSVVGRKNGKTYFSLNVIPSDEYPRRQREAIQRRLMIRLQMLAQSKPEPAP